MVTVYWCANCRDVVVMVVPQHYRGFMIGLGGEGIDVRRLSHACVENVVERNLPGAGGAYALSGHEPGHAKDVDDGLVDTVGGERAEAFEIVFVFKLERPRQHGNQIDFVPVPEGEETLDSCGGVGGI